MEGEVPVKAPLFFMLSGGIFTTDCATAATSSGLSVAQSE